MYRMYSFSKPFEAIDYKNKVLNKTSHSFSFHDREDIRRRLAVDSDGESDIFGCNRIARKSSLASRLQSGQSLQICFMNENVNDVSNQANDELNTDDNTRNTFSKIINDNTVIDNSQCAKACNNEISPNNNSCIRSLNPSTKFEELLIDDNTNKIDAKCKRPSNLFTKLGFGPNVFGSLKIFSTIPKPTDKEQFQNYHARLHGEARFALAQVKEIVKRQMEVEQQITMKRSPIYNLIKLPFRYQFRKNKISKSILLNLSVSQLQLIVNDLFSQVEALNEELVQLLVERDESHMEQDSILVDIEDLTIFLISKQ